MAITTHVIDAPPQRVFDVLADGWTYSDWVVGTAHIRDVDARWPEAGAQLHHRAGPWPVSVQDRTDILACEPPTSLVMRPHLWPLGAAIVHLHLTPIGDRSTKVEMWEDFEAGPLRWARTKINDLALHYRNQESLRRLADLATRRR